MNEIVKDEYYFEDLESLSNICYEQDPDEYDYLYHKVPIFEFSSGDLDVTIFRLHPLKGVMMRFASSGDVVTHFSCGFRSYSDIAKVFMNTDENSDDIMTFNGGIFSITQAMKDHFVHGTTYLVYQDESSILGVCWHLGIYGNQREDLKTLASRIVTFCNSPEF